MKGFASWLVLNFAAYALVFEGIVQRLEGGGLVGVAPVEPVRVRREAVRGPGQLVLGDRLGEPERGESGVQR